MIRSFEWVRSILYGAASSVSNGGFMEIGRCIADNPGWPVGSGGFGQRSVFMSAQPPAEVLCDRAPTRFGQLSRLRCDSGGA
jgi:hypothetical protein